MKNYDIEKQHQKKKYHAIERILLLLDGDSFREIGSGIDNYAFNHNGSTKSTEYDGVITGRGTICGKTVFIFSQDFTVSGGSIGLNHGKKIAYLIEKARKAHCPIIGLYDSGGARIGEGINALAGCGEMMHQNALASGVIPQISIIVGPCAGAAAYSPAITDFVFMVEQIGQLYITGPKVIEEVTGEKCTVQELGGAEVHSSCSGVAHFKFSSEKKCYLAVRQLISVLPSCYKNDLLPDEYIEKVSNVKDLIPDDDKLPYSMKDVISEVIDEDSFIEVHKDFASNMITGFGQISGITIGIVANNPMSKSGAIDIDASDKTARFVRFCDSFNIPILTLVDTSGYLPGLREEHGGIIRHGAKMLFAYSEATTVKITVIVRKAYGGAYIAMGSKHLGADYLYACHGASLAVMGAQGAVSILHGKELKEVDAQQAEALKNKYVDEYTKEYLNPTIAVREGYIDEVIEYNNIRQRVYEDITALKDKSVSRIEKKHGNIPL